jgi:formylglycine-generating enzyme required for sulfatase activity
MIASKFYLGFCKFFYTAVYRAWHYTALLVQSLRNRYLVLFIFAFLFFNYATAQDLVVRTFEENNRDLSARVKERVDINGISCALVKIDLPLKNVVISAVGDVDYVVNTYWVYLAAGTKKLSLQHPDYHTLQVVFSDYDIQYVTSKTTYYMVVDLPNATHSQSIKESNSIDSSLARENFTDLIDTKVINVKETSFTMVYVKGGTFIMGASSVQDEYAGKNEFPSHNVTLSDYYIGKFEVTQKLWKAVMNNNPSKYVGDDRPVDSVSWNDCITFIERINALTGLSFSLPTEAQWEYAAKGGVFAEVFLYSGSDKAGSVAWFSKNTKATKNTGLKQPNALGLFDMSGNVGEWCMDYYGLYTNDSQENPTGPDTGTIRVTRGGDWYSDESKCRTSYRTGASPTGKYDDMGFRLVLIENKPK